MKTPRITDFDPKAETPKLASPLDTMPAIRPPKKPAAHTPVGRPDTQTPRVPDAKTPRRPEPQTPRRPDAASFELTARAEERQTLRLTDGEFRRLGAVQSQLGEQLGVKKVDKNDLIRCAIHALFEEYERNGEGSELVRRLRQKYR